MTEEETGGRRRLHNEVLHNLYSSPTLYEDSNILLEKFRACSTQGAEREMQNSVKETLGQ
jgi:hypothetical protein